MFGYDISDLKKNTLIIPILIFNSYGEIPKGSVKFVNSQNRKQKIGESKILIFFNNKWNNVQNKNNKWTSVSSQIFFFTNILLKLKLQ